MLHAWSPLSSPYGWDVTPSYLTARAVMREMMLMRSELKSKIIFMKDTFYFCFLDISARI